MNKYEFVNISNHQAASISYLRTKQECYKGAGAHRCTFCGALLTGKEEFCNVCNSSTISKNAEQNGRRVNDAPIWKKRFRDCGQPNGGYES